MVAGIALGSSSHNQKMMEVMPDVGGDTNKDAGEPVQKGQAGGVTAAWGLSCMLIYNFLVPQL